MSALELIEKYQQQHPEKFHPHQTTNAQNNIRTTKINQDSQINPHPSNPLHIYTSTNSEPYHLSFEQTRMPSTIWPASATSDTISLLKTTQNFPTKTLNPSPSLQTMTSQTTASSPCLEPVTFPCSHWMDQSIESTCGSKEVISTLRPP